MCIFFLFIYWNVDRKLALYIQEGYTVEVKISPSLISPLLSLRHYRSAEIAPDSAVIAPPKSLRQPSL